MFRKIIFPILIFCVHEVAAQRKPYFTNEGDMIFSYSIVTDSTGDDVKSNLRFSSWYHVGEILNVDFSKSAGLITGLSLQNVGMITEPADGILLKQRNYSLGLPVGFRFGDLENRHFIMLGAMGECMLDYKEKVFKNGEKVQKHHEWLSNNSNLINPSVFLKFQKKSVYIMAKYYLFDLFQASDIKISEDSYLPAFPKTSRIFYLSIGYSSKGKSKSKKTSSPEKINLTYTGLSKV